jgi:hypothetical protein
LNAPVSITVAPSGSSAPADPCSSAEAHWKAADGIGSIAAYEDHLTRYPGCAFASLAKARIGELKQKMAAAPATDAARGSATSRDFDGKWEVTVSCTAVGKAQGYTRMLTATVRDGVFRAEDQESKSNWLTIDGDIPPGGKTTLLAKGVTGNPAFNAGNVQAGVPYAYTIDAQFERGKGTGKRNELRPCTLTFAKR